MLTCLKTCSRMRWTVLLRPWRSTTLRRTSLPTSRRSLTRSTTPRGIALWVGTLAATLRTRRSISSTSTWGRWPSCSSSPAEPRWRTTPDQNCNALMADALPTHLKKKKKKKKKKKDSNWLCRLHGPCTILNVCMLQ
ncbi:hypothetical protein AAFF_G00196000 [Aldrovandia affinis]|uniref:Uncharacterized protein n=1 Tax=Aldrovandia affinis TaxID=143900 RepID=A0AAD7RJ95_9TELE|nr:hypothetical protein AAFF_G00196000 [Aldrovandia affinis]